MTMMMTAMTQIRDPYRPPSGDGLLFHRAARHPPSIAVSLQHMDTATPNVHASPANGTGVPTASTTTDPARAIRRDIAAFAAIGATAMLYLVYVHYKPSGSAFCDFGDGFSCEIVNKSVYADIFGVPISVIGLAYFVVIGVLSRRDLFAKYVEEIQALTVASLVFGLYLTWIEVYLLGSICVFCELAKVMMIAVAVTTVIAAKRSGVRLMAKWTPLAAAAGLVGIMLARYAWSAFA